MGEWTPSNELNHVLPMKFYGYRNPLLAPQSHPSPFADLPVTEPAIQLPQDEIANSPTQPILIPEGLPYAGQMLVGDMKHGGIQRLYLEKVDGVWQGAAFLFSMGFEAGVNRLAWGRGGTLFVGGIGGDHGSTWSWIDPAGARTYQGLQRLTPTGVTAYDIAAVRATGEVDEEDLTVTEAVPGSSGIRVRLRVSGLREGRVVHLRTDPPSRNGEALWTTEAWYTMNRIPR